MQWLVFLLSVALIWALGGPAALRAEMPPVRLSAEAQRGAFSVRAALAFAEQGPVPEVALSFVPQCPTTTITFRTDSLSCVLVRPGQVLAEGDLIGYASAEIRARLEELLDRFSEVQDELVRAELAAEIDRLRAQNEIRALIPGRVLSVQLQQEGNEIRVQVLLQRP